MIDQGSITAFEYYRDLLQDMGVTAKNMADTNDTALPHLLWMCEHCIPMIESQTYPPHKYSRWLGFVQGCLICHNHTSVATERDRTRPWFKDQT